MSKLEQFSKYALGVRFDVSDEFWGMLCERTEAVKNDPELYGISFDGKISCGRFSVNFHDQKEVNAWLESMELRTVCQCEHSKSGNGKSKNRI